MSNELNNKDIKPYVQLSHINKFFGDFKASNDVSFSVEKGKLVGLLGPSGSGKTTILRILAGLETADSGEIYIDGKLVNNVAPSKRGIGFVFQNYALFRYQTVFDNVAFALKIAKWKKKDIQERVMDLINLVGLKGMEKRYPNELSGGQRQRVAFARALAIEPQLLLLDEPFAAIDAKVRKELRSWLKDLISRVGITSIFVTHDQDEAIEVADQIIITNHGRVEQSGSPYEIYREPQTAFVSEFIGSPTIIQNPGIFKGFNDIDSGSRAVLRPEFISIAKITDKFKYQASADIGEVEKLFFRGTDIEVNIRVKGELITVHRPIAEEPVEVGEKVYVFVTRYFKLTDNNTTTVINETLENENNSYII